MSRLRMAVIGVGHLGKCHARILARLPEVELVAVVDVQAEQAETVARELHTTAYSDHRLLLDRVDAATIVVPTTHHFAVASDFLRRRIPVLVEKPLASNLTEAERLVELARQQRTLLQVGHIERFNPAFEQLQRRPLQPCFITAERVGPFTGRATDVGVVLDLMIHDIDLALALVRAPVKTVEGMGVRLFGEHEDIAHVRLHFSNGCVANLTASRAHPTAWRKMQVWAPEGYAGIDFTRKQLVLVQPTEQLRRQGIDVSRLEPAARARLRDEFFEKYFQTQQMDCHHGDQLTSELQHFLQCVRSGSRPRVSGEDGLRAIALVERILESIRRHRWQGRDEGPCGPCHLPAPLGALLPPIEEAAA